MRAAVDTGIEEAAGTNIVKTVTNLGIMAKADIVEAAVAAHRATEVKAKVLRQPEIDDNNTKADLERKSEDGDDADQDLAAVSELELMAAGWRTSNRNPDRTSEMEKGIHKNRIKAKVWFEKAADQENMDVQLELKTFHLARHDRDPLSSLYANTPQKKR